jgi:hypothetical protein
MKKDNKTIKVSVGNGNLFIAGDFANKVFDPADVPGDIPTIRQDIEDISGSFLFSFKKEYLTFNGLPFEAMPVFSLDRIIGIQEKLSYTTRVNRFFPNGNMIRSFLSAVEKSEGKAMASRTEAAISPVSEFKLQTKALVALSAKVLAETEFSGMQAEFAGKIETYLDRIPEKDELSEELLKRAPSIKFSVESAAKLANEFLGSLPKDKTGELLKDLPKEYQKQQIMAYLSPKYFQALINMQKFMADMMYKQLDIENNTPDGR